MSNVIENIVRDVIREHAVDTRLCHIFVSSSDGVVECSDGKIAAILRGRLEERADTRARVEELPRAGTPECMLVTSAVADVRREPSHPSELVNQVIHGDVVTPFKVLDEWTLARIDDGYIGWIRNWHLAAWTSAKHDAFLAAVTHRVRANHTPLLSSPGGAAVAELVVGTPLVTGEPAGRGWVEVRLADGLTGCIPRSGIEKITRRRPTPARLAATGLRFVGIPYLWGGNTPNGFDCSGLIQRVFRLNGVLLPRDSDQQARIGEERATTGPGDLTAGSLVFFGKSRESITHVGLVLPDGTILHSYGQVVVNSLDPSHPRYLPRLGAIWQLTRDPLAKASPGRRAGPTGGRHAP